MYQVTKAPANNQLEQKCEREDVPASPGQISTFPTSQQGGQAFQSQHLASLEPIRMETNAMPGGAASRSLLGLPATAPTNASSGSILNGPPNSQEPVHLPDGNWFSINDVISKLTDIKYKTQIKDYLKDCANNNPPLVECCRLPGTKELFRITRFQSFDAKMKNEKKEVDPQIGHAVLEAGCISNWFSIDDVISKLIIPKHDTQIKEYLKNCANNNPPLVECGRLPETKGLYRITRFQSFDAKMENEKKEVDPQIGRAVLEAGRISVRSRIQERLSEGSIYSDWYHDISALMTMLAERNVSTAEEMTKLIKFVVMRNQLQAPFDDSAMIKARRQTSPLVSEDYARGMRTRLWTVATNIQLDVLKEHCIGVESKSRNKSDFIKKFDKKFYVVSTPQPFPYLEMNPEIMNQLPDAPLKDSLLFFSNLRLQVLPINGEKQKFTGQVSKHMGARGLRSSLGESAQTIAEALTKRIQNSDLQGALKLLESEFRSKTAVRHAKNPLSSIEYGHQHLLATTECDQLRNSTKRQIDDLEQAYIRFEKLHSCMPSDLMKSNFTVFQKLMGSSIREFFGTETPALVTGIVTDTLSDISDLISLSVPAPRSVAAASRSTMDSMLNGQSDLANRKSLLERYYEKMQILHEAVRFQLSWRGDALSALNEGISYMLPENDLKPISTHAAPHGLAMIDQINRALRTDAKTSVGILKSSYYETPDLFEEHKTFDTVEHPELLNCDLIVLEPHPNNAEERDVKAHNPVNLLNSLVKHEKRRTVLMDITLNHMSEKEIDNVLKAAEPMIKSGNLNLVLMQSGTKFLQHGMDIVSLGVAAVFNNQDCWETFNSRMQQTKQSVPNDDALYLGRILKTCKSELGEYVEQIRKNTATLRKNLIEKLVAGSALEVTGNDDNKTVYVAIAPTQECINEVYRNNILQDSKGRKKTPEEFAMHDVFLRILKAAEDLSLVHRSSFGFNLTNIGECLTTIRITPGIEDSEFFNAYAERIADVAAELKKEMDARKWARNNLTTTKRAKLAQYSVMTLPSDEREDAVD